MIAFELGLIAAGVVAIWWWRDRADVRAEVAGKLASEDARGGGGRMGSADERGAGPAGPPYAQKARRGDKMDTPEVKAAGIARIPNGVFGRRSCLVPPSQVAA